MLGTLCLDKCKKNEHMCIHVFNLTRVIASKMMEDTLHYKERLHDQVLFSAHMGEGNNEEYYYIISTLLTHVHTHSLSLSPHAPPLLTSSLYRQQKTSTLHTDSRTAWTSAEGLRRTRYCPSSPGVS